MRHLYFNSHARVGRDMFRVVAINSDTDFNSHARVGRDSRRNLLYIPPLGISTHTPAWGVTKQLGKSLL